MRIFTPKMGLLYSLLLCCFWSSTSPAKTSLPHVHEFSQAPAFKFSGDYANEYFEVGQKYSIIVEVTDPDDRVTLSIEDVVNEGESVLESANFAPALPLSGTGTLRTELRWTATAEQLGFTQIYLLAEDAAGNKTRRQLELNIIKVPSFDFPAEPIQISVDQDWLISVPVKNNESVRELTASSETLPLVYSDNGDHINIAGNYEQTPTEEHLGTHTIWVSALIGSSTSIDFKLEVTVVSGCHNTVRYIDSDGDGYGTGEVRHIICSSLTGYASNNQDCQDTTAAVNPGVAEIPGDGLDNNCDGRIDETAAPNSAPVITIAAPFIDAFVGEAVSTSIQAVDPDAGDLVTLTLDSAYIISRVDPLVPTLEGLSFSPTLPHMASGTATTTLNWMPQDHQRGYIFMFFSATDQHGNKTDAILYAFVESRLMLQPIPPIVVGTNQSFEAFMTVEHADAIELIEEVTLENAPSWLNAEAIPLIDDGKRNLIRIWGTAPKASWGTYRPTIHASTLFAQQASQEIQVRVGNCKNQLWYKDADGDGYGAENITLTACWQVEGYVSMGGDCNDGDAAIYPGATELSDAVDNNCNGMVDEEGGCFATNVVSFRQGPRPDGKVIGASRSNPRQALGAPQENTNYNFVSLGFGGELVLELGSLLYDDGSSAPDLMVVETTWGWAWRPCYDDEFAGNPETMQMEVSADGWNWVTVPGSFCRNAKVDLSSVVGEGKLPHVRFIKITDTSNPADFHPSSNGYDVDGIITCPALFEELQANARTAATGSFKGFNANFFNEVPEEEEALQQLSVYPNPVRDVLSIETGAQVSESITLSLYNLQGALIYKGNHLPDPASGQIQLNLQHLKQGIYMLQVHGKEQQHYLKIIKE